MKLAIPADKKDIETSVSGSFGRAPYFFIYNTDTKEGKFVDNSAMSSTGGAGIKAAQTVVDNDVNVLLTPQLGENAADVFKAADVKIYQSVAGSIKDNIDSYIKGNLSVLDEIHSGFHGHRGGK